MRQSHLNFYLHAMPFYTQNNLIADIIVILPVWVRRLTSYMTSPGEKLVHDRSGTRILVS